MVSGHEYAGEIVEIRANVTSINVGDIASGEGHIICGRCRNCLAGRLHCFTPHKRTGARIGITLPQRRISNRPRRQFPRKMLIYNIFLF